MNPPGTPLTSADLAAMARCGIGPELCEAALLRRVDSRTGAELIGQRPTEDRDYSGIVIPFIWPGEDYIRENQLRRDYPDLEDRSDGGPPKEKGKYMFPPGKGNLLYFPPGVDPAWLQDASLPAIIVEGAKKALALSELSWRVTSDSMEKPGWLTIAIAGVWNWKGTNGKATSASGKRVSTNGPIGDLTRVIWRGRKTTVLFDSNVRSKPEVQIARWEFSKYLRSKSARVYWFEWPQTTPSGVNGVDDLLGRWGADRVLETIQQFTHPAPANYGEQQNSPREFNQLSEDRYTLAIPALGIIFDIDRLRRDHHELKGELTVKCSLPGVRSFNGVLSSADFNLSSTRTRSELAKLLVDRAKTDSLDWFVLVEEFCQRVMAEERKGKPAVDLSTVPRPDPERNSIRVAGLELLRQHPSILFGDGGSAKSYLALYLAGCLTQQGIRTAVFDWELSAEDHRVRLELLFGKKMPPVRYVKCDRPLTSEADRLRRIVLEDAIEYAFYDSVAFACDGPPEAAEVANRYFRSVRQIGIGALHLAHISRAEGNDQAPFGSVFWKNSCRSMWFVKAAEETPDQTILDIGLYQRKANLSAKARAPIAYRITFREDRTTFQSIDPASVQELAEKMNLYHRMLHLLSRGAMTKEVIAEELGAKITTIEREARRHRDQFTLLEGGKIGLLSKKAEER
jgi:hypothetical protein